MSTSVCPRCSLVRDLRDGPYFVCRECRWCWTVSITGKVYVQSVWPPYGSTASDAGANHRARRLLGSIDGLAETLDSTEWPAAPASPQLRRLERARDAIAAGFYNEGLPLAQLKAEGVLLPPAQGEPSEPI